MRISAFGHAANTASAAPGRRHVHYLGGSLPPAGCRQLGLGGGECVGAARHEVQHRPFARKGVRASAANAPGRTGDNHALAGEPEVHGCLRLWWC